MARNLDDVADYFLPRAGGALVAPRGAPPERPAALPILAIPIGERDVVRSAFAWNLAVELARLGASAALLAPRGDEPSPVWPEGGPGPMDTEVVLCDARDLAALGRAALDLAVARAPECERGFVLVRVPPEWLHGNGDARALLRWVLLFTAGEPRELAEAFALAKAVMARSAGARVGVTIHGARRVARAEESFRRLADATARQLGRSVVSYGLLVDDLHVYRGIVARRPIGLEHPQSAAARALRDVAQLLMEDAGRPGLA
ncbi:MAG TPA: hypothetical protein VFC77_13470 [Myxococcota bacterium]|nr:hypothetical protein [Myxococcota bacterium]